MIGPADREVNKCGAVVQTRVAAQVCPKRVQYPVEPGITVYMTMGLIAGIPIDPERAIKESLIHHPFAVVTIQVGVAHLHRQRVNRTIGKKRHTALRNRRHAAVPACQSPVFGNDFGIIVIQRCQSFAVRRERPAIALSSNVRSRS